jgi:hypothetical protein
MKLGCNLAKSSKDVFDVKRAVLPIMVMSFQINSDILIPCPNIKIFLCVAIYVLDN